MPHGSTRERDDRDDRHRRHRRRSETEDEEEEDEGEEDDDRNGNDESDDSEQEKRRTAKAAVVAQPTAGPRGVSAVVGGAFHAITPTYVADGAEDVAFQFKKIGLQFKKVGQQLGDRVKQEFTVNPLAGANQHHQSAMAKPSLNEELGASGGGLPPEPEGLRDAIRAFVDSYEYWHQLLAVLRNYLDASAQLAEAEGELGKLLAVGVIKHGDSPALSSGAFGQASTTLSEGRAKVNRDLKKHIVDQLATHVEIALTDASESVNAYEEGLVDCTVQFQFAKKLEAKGQRKSAETAAAFKKLQDMQNRIRPQAERCKDKLTMLMQKQTMDLERWLLRHATAVKLLQEQSVTSLSACLRLQERMLISRSALPAVVVEEEEEEEMQEATVVKDRSKPRGGGILRATSWGGAKAGDPRTRDKDRDSRDRDRDRDKSRDGARDKEKDKEREREERREEREREREREKRAAEREREKEKERQRDKGDRTERGGRDAERVRSPKKEEEDGAARGGWFGMKKKNKPSIEADVEEEAKPDPASLWTKSKDKARDRDGRAETSHTASGREGGDDAVRSAAGDPSSPWKKSGVHKTEWGKDRDKDRGESRDARDGGITRDRGDRGDRDAGRTRDRGRDRDRDEDTSTSLSSRSRSARDGVGDTKSNRERIDSVLSKSRGDRR